MNATLRKLGANAQQLGIFSLIGIAAVTAFPSSGMAQNSSATISPISATSYADVADYAADAATIVHARVRSAVVIDDARAQGVPANLVRFYVEADVRAVLYGSTPLAARVGYITDQPRLPNGRPPRLNRAEVLLFARRPANQTQLTLVHPRGQINWTPDREAIARSIARELGAGKAPPQITGISQAFHVAGTIAGESETQIFLSTANNQPVSLSILRRPGMQPQWAVAFGEIVDESASRPARRTLGWYRLACGLPATVPASAMQDTAPADRTQIAQDYALVTSSVGVCDRTPPPAAAAAPAR